MKKLGKWIFILIASLGGVTLIFFFYLRSTAPNYSGKLFSPGLVKETEVYFDEWGIPHIYAHNLQDAYFSLGYVQAQDRLFQMEMLRRLASGRMAEVVGREMLNSDRFFRTLGIRDRAEKTAQQFLEQPDSDYKKAMMSYLDGINLFLEQGQTPLEFQLMSLPKEKFTPADVFTVFGLVALGFSNVTTEEPVVTRAWQKYGEAYMKDWMINPIQPTVTSATNQPTVGQQQINLSSQLASLFPYLPPLALGSNSWALSPSKSTSGKALLANDTHMFFAQPAIWYEAHIEYPGFSFYGNYLAGVPFGIVGHNHDVAWGLTIFPLDNMDMYFEKKNPENVSQVWVIDHWQSLEERKEVIKIKGDSDTTITVQISRHGPIMNTVLNDSLLQTDLVSLRWLYNEVPTQLIEAFYQMDHARNMKDARDAAKKIDVLGLNVVYADKENNIAWWASGKISKRPAHVNSKLILDGASGKDDLIGYYDFSENPHEENPERGFVFSANNEPPPVNGFIYPGHYTPSARANRIKRILEGKEKWTVEEMKSMHRDVVADTEADLCREMIKNISVDEQDNVGKQAIELLRLWDGDHQREDVEPVIYNKFLFHTLKECMQDELGEKDFQAIASSYTVKRTYQVLFKNDTSLWWDNVNTKDVKETREQIFKKAFDISLNELKKQLGDNINNWKWGKVHTLTHQHPIGKKKPFDKLFNVGPFPMPGTNEVMNKMGFALEQDGAYEIVIGPTLRILLDFADVENSLSVSATGQSGNVMSPHYSDQTELYNKGEYRKQMMNEKEIKSSVNKLVLSPIK